MKRLEKIIQLTTHIYNLYIDIFNMDLQGLYGTREYLKKLDDLKLYKEFEDKYYDELNKKYNVDEITNIIGHLNLDNIVDPSKSDMAFTSYEFFESSYEETIIKRRIYNRLNGIMISKINNDELFSHIKAILGSEIVNEHAIQIGTREILILDRTHTLLNLLQRATEKLCLRYMYYNNDNIAKHSDKESFISKKYMISFIITNIENRLLKQDFKVDVSLIKNIKEENSELNQEVYEFFLLKNSIDLFNSAIREFLDLDNYNLTKEDKDFYMADLSAVIRATSLEMSESLIKMMIMVINNPNNMDHEKTKVMRKELTRIIMETNEGKNCL